MAFDLNKEYNLLIKKHRVFFDQMCADGFCVLREAGCSCGTRDTLADAFFDELPKDAKIAVCGTGYYTHTLVTALNKKNQNKILYYTCTDEIREGVKFQDHEVISLQALKEKDVDCIVLSTREYRVDMRSNLLKEGFTDEQLYDIYTPLEELSGLAVNSRSAKQPCCGYQCISTVEIYPWVLSFLYEYYENSMYILHERRQVEALYSAISGFVVAHDIINTKRLAQIYIKKKYPLHESLKACITDLDILITQARKLVQSRKHDAIIIYLFDAYEYINLSYMPNLEKLYTKSLVFNRAFTQFGWTSSTLQIMFTGRDLVDEKAFEVAAFTDENSPLLQTMKANGYKLHVFRTDYRVGLFPNSPTVTSHVTPNIASSCLFEMLTVLTGEDRKQVLFMHLFETHRPFYSPYNNSYERFIVGKPLNGSLSEFASMVRTLCYLDEQFCYYDSFLPSSAVKIVMSDHGFFNSPVSHEHYMSDSLYDYVCNFYGGTRVALFIDAPYIKPGIIDDFFCLKDFDKLLGFIWQQCDISSILVQYIKFQTLPTYAKEQVKDIPIVYLPQRGIIDKNGFYKRLYDGEESFFSADCIKSNNYIKRIDDPAYSETVNKMRKLCGDWSYDLFEHPKMKYAKAEYRKRGLI